MQFLQRTSLLGLAAGRPRRTATLIAAADCVSAGSVSRERRRPCWSPLHPNHTQLAQEAEQRLHYLVRHCRYWRSAAAYAESTSPGGRPFMSFFPFVRLTGEPLSSLPAKSRLRVRCTLGDSIRTN